MKKGSHWPTAAQQDLLLAATLPGDRALAALRRWLASDARHDVDSGSYRVLPAVSANLREHAGAEPFLNTIFGIQRREWLATQVLLHNSLPILNAFERNGIPFMLLKGAALIATFPDQRMIRPIRDIDVLVHPGHYPDALDIVAAAQWTTVRGLHAQMFHSPNGKGEIDLHVVAMKHALDDGREFDVWTRSVEREFGSMRVRVPSVSDQLVHTCVHGIAWNAVPPIRWIVDAVRLISSGAVDWNVVVCQAEKLRAGIPMRKGLEYLRDVFGCAVPEEVLTKLAAIPASLDDRLVFLADTRPGMLGHALIPWRWIRYRKRLSAARHHRKVSAGAPHMTATSRKTAS